MKWSVPRRRPVGLVSTVVASCTLLAALAVPAATAQPAHPASAPAAAAAAAAKSDPVVSGKRYYMTVPQLNRGVSFQTSTGSDWAHLTNNVGENGTPVIFNKQDDGSYTVTSVHANWAGRQTWCPASDIAGTNGIALTPPDQCGSTTHFFIEKEANDAYVLRVAGYDTWVGVTSNLWLAPTVWRNHAPRFKITPQ